MPAFLDSPSELLTVVQSVVFEDFLLETAYVLIGYIETCDVLQNLSSCIRHKNFLSHGLYNCYSAILITYFLSFFSPKII